MMVRFTNGPAIGVEMFFQRAPLLLRVVKNDKGQWDALDQLSDIPQPNESIHMYWINTRQPGYMFVDYRSRCGCRRGNRTMIAEYVSCPHASDDQVMRDRAAWEAWEKMLAEKAGNQ